MSNIQRLQKTLVGYHLYQKLRAPALSRAQQWDIVRHVEDAINNLSGRQGEITFQLLDLLRNQREKRNTHLWETVVPLETRQAFDKLNLPLQRAAERLENIFSNILRPDTTFPATDILEALREGKSTGEIPASEIASFKPREKKEILSGLNSFQAFYLYIIALGYELSREENIAPENNFPIFSSRFFQKIAEISPVRKKDQPASVLKKAIQDNLKHNFDIFFLLSRTNPQFINGIEQLLMEICLSRESFIPFANLFTGSTEEHSLATANFSAFWAFAQRLKAYVEGAKTDNSMFFQISPPPRICHNDKIILPAKEQITIDIAPLAPILHTIMTSVLKRLDQAPAVEIVQEIIWKYYVAEKEIYARVFDNKSENEKTILLGLILQAAGFKIQILRYTKDDKTGLALEVCIYPNEAPIICIPFYKDIAFARGTEEKVKQQIKKYNEGLDHSSVPDQNARITYPDYQASGLNPFFGIAEKGQNNTSALREFDEKGILVQSPGEEGYSFFKITVQRFIDKTEKSAYPTAFLLPFPPSSPSVPKPPSSSLTLPPPPLTREKTLSNLQSNIYPDQAAFNAAAQEITEIVSKIETDLNQELKNRLSLANDLAAALLTIHIFKSAHLSFSHAGLEKVEEKINHLNQDILRSNRP